MNHAASQTNRDSEWAHLLDAAAQDAFFVPCESITGRRVLITGAGGSIGSALTRSVSLLHPEKLVLLEASENALYKVDRNLKATNSAKHVAILDSVSDERCLVRLFESYRPQVVLHAAAFKQVPLMEENPLAAIANNAIATYTLAKAAAAFPPAQLLLISTDKAADPASIMGVSKRIAEIVTMTVANEGGMKAAVLRLGNVLGSDGSVLPLFLEQIAAGGPITVTHPAARRYMMTMQQVVESVFAALVLPKSPALVIPELGEQRSILAMAHHLLELHSSTAKIQFTGLRPGDKMEETLLSQGESWGETFRTASCVLRLIQGPTSSSHSIEAAVVELNRALARRDLDHLFAVILTLVPGYRQGALIAASLQSELSLGATTCDLQPAGEWLA